MEGQKNKYHFVAVSPDGKKFSGTIWAESEDDAREKISERGLALFSIEAFSAEHAAITEGFTQFEFEGVGADGKTVRGTIESTDGYEAYQKLKREYDFEIKNVITLAATPAEREEYKKLGIPEEWKVRFKLEHGKEKEDEKEIKKKKKKNDDDDVLLSEQDRAELLFYQEEIGKLTTEVIELLQENEDFLEATARRAILDRIGLLSRLRRSNAIDHLRELTKKLLKQLSDDKLFIESEKLSAEQQEQLGERKAEFGDFSKKLEKNVASGIASVSVGLAAIDTDKVKLQIIQSDPLRKVFQVFYLSIASLLGLMIVFWGVNTIRLLANFSQNAILYSFSSPMLWVVTGISLILTFGLFPVEFGWEKLSLRHKLFFSGISLVSMLLFLWFSPMLFWWTR